MLEQDTDMAMAEFDSPDAHALYERMRPDQRAAVVHQFIRELNLAGEPVDSRFSDADERPTDEAATRSIANREPTQAKLFSLDEAAELHRHVYERQPEIFARVREHPVTQAVLAAPGAEAAEQQAEDLDVSLPLPEVPKTSTALDHPAP